MEWRRSSGASVVGPVAVAFASYSVMQVPFTPPKGAAFKQFVILDSDGVVAALSAIDGGKIDEILTRSAEERGGEAGGSLGVGPAKATGKRAKGRKVEEEIRRARTRHAAAAKLIEALQSSASLGVVDGPLDLDVAAQITAGMVLQFRAELRLHPLHQADKMIRSFINIAPKFGEKETAASLRPVLTQWGALLGTGQADGRLLLEPYTAAEPQSPRLLMPVPGENFEIGVDDVLGEVTVIAQVERILGVDDNYPAIRMLRGAPSTPFELSALEETLPDLVSALGGIGMTVSRDDIFIRGPALILRAICAYR